MPSSDSTLTSSKYRLSQQPIPVTLTPEEVQQTLDFVEAMRVDKVKHGVVDRMFDTNNTSEGINIIGHLGEMAVGKVLGIPVDMEVRTGGDDGHDMHLGKFSIQVKTSTLDKLIFNAKHLFKSDVAILVQYIGKDRQKAAEDPRFVIWGWIEREVFLKEYYPVDYGHGTRLVYDAIYLHTLDDLVEDSQA
jgi:hypothetical protein